METNIFIQIFDAASSEPTEGIKGYVKEREGKLFFEQMTEERNLSPGEFLQEVIKHNNKHSQTGYESY